MAGIMERIYPLGTKLECLEDFCGSRFTPVPTTLITGPVQSMKTAMLMQAAVSEGSSGGQVLFIAPNKLSRLPPCIHGMSRPTSSAMNNIQFLYATQPSELQGFLASLHLTAKQDLPSLIIIDDLQHYVPMNETNDAADVMVSIARLLSLAQEAGGYCYSSLGNIRENTDDGMLGNVHPCSVLITWSTTSSDIFTPSELEAFSRDYCHHVWNVKHCHDQGEASSSQDYQMTSNFKKASCTISFRARRLLSPDKDIVMQQAVLETHDNS